MLRSLSRAACSSRSTMTKRHYTPDPNAPPMLRYQSALPALPVPTLSSSLSKYLSTVQPLLTPTQLAHTQRNITDFLSSPLAAELQNRLHERAERVGDNWLSEWWNDVAYMSYRDPVVVFVSYFFVHVEDRTRKDGTQRAAELIKAMLPFRTMWYA
ncbi:CoA-dependent acyltransferase [Tricholoma matsutake]|nr:CoA-dependent acyltransferase [Tricholoma matsutake 945]